MSNYINIAHIINPVIVNNSSDLFIAQPITFETMRAAKEFAKNEVDVSLFSAQYAEDYPIIPDFFSKTVDLDRSILDMGSFNKQRKLPLIKDILDRLYAASDADYLIYTNVDIALQPHFYVAVKKIIEFGYDAFIINRRTISKKYTKIDQIPFMYAAVGDGHPGYDCFVFKRNLYDKFYLGNACIGADWIGKIITANLVCFSNKFNPFKDLHLTFHIGDDQAWKNNGFVDYDRFNKVQLEDVLNKISNTKMDDNELIASFWKKLNHYHQKQPIYVIDKVMGKQ